MNRLIILGNGFDLAHGLRTSYSDFMLDLLKNEVEQSFTHSSMDNYTDETRYVKETIVIKREGNLRIDKAVVEHLQQITTIEEFQSLVSKYHITLSGTKDRTIFHRTYNHLKNFNWADIEAAYYDILLGILENNVPRKLSDAKKAEVITLNQELDFFRNRLIEYLERMETEGSLAERSGPRFWERIKNRNFYNEYPPYVHILNFNYTSTINYYGGHGLAFGESNSQVEIDNIHGRLDDESSVIFGYGDEVDSYYKRMEDLNENELLRHAKSFGYFKNHNYRKLISFLASDKYEVWIAGHSCGLSDRVMLKKIFEHGGWMITFLILFL